MKRIILSLLLVVTGPQMVFGQTKSQLKALDQYLTVLTEKDLFSGALLVAQGDEILLERAYGYANRSWKGQNNLDTKFNLASMGKMFTAISIARLVERGELSLETKVGEILPELTNEAIKSKVTIRHLLGHKAGIGDIFTSEYTNSDRSKYRSVSDWDDIYLNNDLSFEPGTSFRYSNGGFLLLGKVIEKISGLSYEEFVKQEIFDPCEMTNSGYFESDLINENLAEGYTYSTGFGFNSSDKLRRNIYMHMPKGGPAGGGYSTVKDLYKFHKALYSHKLVSKETLELFTKRDTGPNHEGYGLGFQTTERFGEPLAGHTGGFQGVNTIYEYYKNKDLTLIVLSNIDMGGMIVAERFSRMRAGMPLASPDLNVSVGDEYRMTVSPEGGLDAGTNQEMVAINGHLMVGGMMRYLPVNENEFYDVIFEDIRITALRNATTNEVEGFAYKNPFESYTMRRLDADEIVNLEVLPVSDDYLSEYTGKYKITEAAEEEISSVLNLTLRKNGLFIEGAVPLLHYEKDKFFDENNQSFQVYFFRNAQGEVAGYELFIGSRRIVKTAKQ